jgi:hypothetical protein
MPDQCPFLPPRSGSDPRIAMIVQQITRHGAVGQVARRARIPFVSILEHGAAQAGIITGSKAVVRDVIAKNKKWENPEQYCVRRWPAGPARGRSKARHLSFGFRTGPLTSAHPRFAITPPVHAKGLILQFRQGTSSGRSLSPSRYTLRGKFQKFGRLDLKSVGQLSDHFNAHIEFALFELAQITSADTGIVGKIVLRNPFRIAQSSKIGRERVPQVHAGRKLGCSVYCTSIYLAKYATTQVLSTEVLTF